MIGDASQHSAKVELRINRISELLPWNLAATLQSDWAGFELTSVGQ
jgi:hypothetical protein